MDCNCGVSQKLSLEEEVACTKQHYASADNPGEDTVLRVGKHLQADTYVSVAVL